MGAAAIMVKESGLEVGCHEEVVSQEVVSAEEEENDVIVDIIQNDPIEKCIQVQADTAERGAQTRESGATKISFSIKSIKDNPNAVQFYTSFVSYGHFLYVFRCLGQSRYELKYKSRALDTEDEFFLFMVKIRRNTEDEELSYQFGISEQVVSKIFHTWLDFLFYQLQDSEVIKFLPRETIDQHMPRDFKAKYPRTRIILDATEIEIGKKCSIMRPKYPSVFVRTSALKPVNILILFPKK